MISQEPRKAELPLENPQLAVPPAQAKQLSKRLQDLLGYKARGFRQRPDRARLDALCRLLKLEPPTICSPEQLGRGLQALVPVPTSSRHALDLSGTLSTNHWEANS
jgi:hypothetical protein